MSNTQAFEAGAPFINGSPLAESSVEIFYRMMEPAVEENPQLETQADFKAEEAKVLSLAKAGDWRELTSFVISRASSEVYLSALAERKSLQLKLDEQAAKMKEPARKRDLKNLEVAVPAALKLRGLNKEFRELYEELIFHISRMTQYRTLTARAAQLASILREHEERNSGVFLSYDKETLGSLKARGFYEINSIEWHNARAAGIGGSDVGAIMRSDPAFGSQNYARVVAAKLGELLAEDDPLIAVRDDLTSAIGRGNAWEEFIRYMVQDKHPELRVAFCKSSWHGAPGVEHRHANFDGLFLDEAGVPEGILEIKTGSNPKKWGPVEDGLDGVPPSYRKQVLWYAATAGLKYGKIVAILDDNDYREYDFSMDDPAIKLEIEQMYEATDKFWDEIQARKLQLLEGTFKPAEKMNRLGTHESIDNVALVYSGYSGESKAYSKKLILNALALAQGPEKRELSRKEFQKIIFQVFARHDPSKRKRPFVGIDIETTTVSARTGRIIETGIVKINEAGDPEVVYSSLHGLPEQARIGVGMGAIAVHHITEDRILDKPLFEDPETAREILEHLKGHTMVAHNLGFEDRFFEANLPGYIEAKASGEITLLDTRKLTKYLMPRSTDNSLQSFTEDNGVPYAGAHAAASDALMMIKALLRLQRTIHSGGRFITRRASASLRMSALEEAKQFESDR